MIRNHCTTRLLGSSPSVGLFILCALGGVTGCLAPAPPNGAVHCSAATNLCPDGYQCETVSATCFRVGALPDMAQVVDLLPMNPPGRDGGLTCSDYCNCISAACPNAAGGFADEKACLDACGRLTQINFDCRTYHCGLAHVDPVTHCPHALGQAVCM